MHATWAIEATIGRLREVAMLGRRRATEIWALQPLESSAQCDVTPQIVPYWVAVASIEQLERRHVHPAYRHRRGAAWQLELRVLEHIKPCFLVAVTRTS